MYRTFAFTTVTVLLGALALTACSDGDGTVGKRAYEVPGALCGIALDPKYLEPFLPGGKVLTTKETAPNSGTTQCSVLVDGDPVLRQTRTWWARGESASSVARGFWGMKGAKMSDDARFVHSGTGGVGKTSSCTSAEHPEQNLYAAIQVFDPDRADPAAVEKLVTAYTKAVEASEECD
ncbi:hypothetical protein [Streptomyces fragilis]|uniref:DUF3558 domain-containing protein n=1 Tax=Streptomyces fragilis TaxID=67301 RepID=A0ABV2YKY9_9ACTN|nr:hypothetical protein [Streptomyces fragilis]